MYSTRPIHWNIKSAPASPGRSCVGPALYIFSLLVRTPYPILYKRQEYSYCLLNRAKLFDAVGNACEDDILRFLLYLSILRPSTCKSCGVRLCSCWHIAGHSYTVRTVEYRSCDIPQLNSPCNTFINLFFQIFIKQNISSNFSLQKPSVVVISHYFSEPYKQTKIIWQFLIQTFFVI